MNPMLTNFAVLSAGIAAPGKTEKDVEMAIYELGNVEYGTRRYWHERIIRSGENSTFPLYIKRETATLQEDDMYYVDLGPVFEKIEADFARTYVLGAQPSSLHSYKNVCHISVCFRVLLPMIRPAYTGFAPLKSGQDNGGILVFEWLSQ